MKAIVTTAATLFIAGASMTSAHAVPVQGQYQDSASCDPLPTTSFDHELGDFTSGFPNDEALDVKVTNAPLLACVSDDGAPNDFLVEITNISPFSWTDLFFVADDGTFIGNADGSITDLNAPGFTDAFKIDNLGVNQNLVAGDVNGNLIFEPGETWEFLVTNFLAPASLPPFPVLGSVGLFAGSSASDFDSNSSIVANQVPVPEPSSVGLVLIGGMLLTVVRRRH